MATAISLPKLPEPLRLPRGSVRGFLAAFVATTFGYLLVQGLTVATVIVNSVIVVIAFYYGGGGRAAPVSSGPAARERPIDIQRRVVQILLLLGLAGLTGWLVRTTGSLSLPVELQVVWQVLGGYLGGMALAWLIHRRAHETSFRRRFAIAFRDISAVGALVLTAAICFGFATGQQGLFFGRAEEALSLVVTYYFGSRVIR